MEIFTLVKELFLKNDPNANSAYKTMDIFIAIVKPSTFLELIITTCMFQN